MRTQQYAQYGHEQKQKQKQEQKQELELELELEAGIVAQTAHLHTPFSPPAVPHLHPTLLLSLGQQPR